MIIKKNKKGSSLNLFYNNFVELLLDFIFFSVLILFLINQNYQLSFLEENYAKNIALLIDSAKPGMKINFDLKEAFDIAKKNQLEFSKIVQIQNNQVLFKLSNSGGKSYSFFNNVEINAYPEYDNNKNAYTKQYVFEILKYNENSKEFLQENIEESNEEEKNRKGEI
jgi:hypothetical protein